MKINVDAYLNSEWEKYCEEQGCDLTEDDLTLLGEHTKKVEKEAEEATTLYKIASVKSYAYCEEYNPYTGTTEQKKGYLLLKEGYIAGFLAGFAHKMGGGHG
jgi:hypothetical protein